MVTLAQELALEVCGPLALADSQTVEKTLAIIAKVGAWLLVEAQLRETGLAVETP